MPIRKGRVILRRRFLGLDPLSWFAGMLSTTPVSNCRKLQGLPAESRTLDKNPEIPMFHERSK